MYHCLQNNITISHSRRYCAINYSTGKKKKTDREKERERERGGRERDVLHSGEGNCKRNHMSS